MARISTGIDVGLRTTQVLRGSFDGNTFKAMGFAVSAHVVKEHAHGWDDLELGFKPTGARIGITGRDVNMRFVHVPRVPDWQLRNLMRFEVAEVGDQSGSEVASDFNLLPELPEIEGEDVVLLCMARESLLESHMEGLTQLGGTLDSFAPSSVALYNSWLRYGVIEDDVVLIANIGHDNIDVVISRGADLLFARNLSGGSRLFDEAISQRFSVSAAQGEKLKVDMASLEAGKQYATPNHERASKALLGAAGQLLSLLQSTLLFAKSQVKIPGLKLDRVLICGGGAALEGLPQYLSLGMSMPVELFDPFRVVDTSGLSPEEADLLEDYKLESVVALGLATMASDKDSYSLEILPVAVAKKREFMNGMLWLIAAAVMGVLYLGYYANLASGRLETVTAESRSVGARLRQAKRVHTDTEELIGNNEDRLELVLDMQNLAGGGEQMARMLNFLDEELPDDFWVQRMSCDVIPDVELRIPNKIARPVFSVKGMTRPGTQAPAVLWQGFTSRLAEALPEVDFNPSISPKGDIFSLDLTHFAPPKPVVAGEEDQEQGNS